MSPKLIMAHLPFMKKWPSSCSLSSWAVCLQVNKLYIYCWIILIYLYIGLTLGLMGMDETNLHVLIQSGTETEKVNAKKVLSLLDRGKHWVLVTLLLSNVIVNETLPIILDGVLGGGWKAVVISTALIVIFGEVIPQSVCVRYGLAIGAKTAG